MSLERSDAVRIAKALAAKMSADPEKYAKIIAAIPQLDDSTSCGPVFGPTPAPGDAVKALAEMHRAVNGVDPDPAEAKDGKASEPQERYCEQIPFGCAASGTYNVCNCDTGGYCTPCAVPNIHNCPGVFNCEPVFKCPGQDGFDCHSFICASVYWQYDHDCPVNSRYTCPSIHICKEEGGDRFSCLALERFNCPNTVECDNNFRCLVIAVGCQGQAFHCQNDNTCDPQPGNTYSCITTFTCGAAGGTFGGCEWGDSFQCPTGSFTCSGSYI